MINFKLADIDNVPPAGTQGDLRMSWFWLTEADLWLNFGQTTIYEYTKEALEYLGKQSTPYNDYPLIRFIEDVTEIFNQIGESIPEKYYILTSDVDSFLTDAKKWLDKYETDEDEVSEFYFNEYDRLVSWVYKRSIDSGHLIGGPQLYFFRNNNKMRVVWKTEYTLENGISLWTAKDGSFEMSYSLFVDAIKEFGAKFFKVMDIQVELAIKKDWGSIHIDKHRLINEHRERKIDFYAHLKLLEQGQNKKTDWTEVEKLYLRMKEELNNEAQSSGRPRQR